MQLQKVQCSQEFGHGWDAMTLTGQPLRRCVYKKCRFSLIPCKACGDHHFEVLPWVCSYSALWNCLSLSSWSGSGMWRLQGLETLAVEQIFTECLACTGRFVTLYSSGLRVVDLLLHEAYT